MLNWHPDADRTAYADYLSALERTPAPDVAGGPVYPTTLLLADATHPAGGCPGDGNPIRGIVYGLLFEAAAGGLLCLAVALARAVWR